MNVVIMKNATIPKPNSSATRKEQQNKQANIWQFLEGKKSFF